MKHSIPVLQPQYRIRIYFERLERIISTVLNATLRAIPTVRLSRAIKLLASHYLETSSKTNLLYSKTLLKISLSDIIR